MTAVLKLLIVCVTVLVVVAMISAQGHGCAFTVNDQTVRLKIGDSK